MKHITILLLSSFILLPSSFGQGSLTPPGPPGPTMRTLEQIEPRTPITNLPYTITAPGSYYVTTNLTGNPGGITIAASGVTLDLMGFELVGGTGNGIFVSGSRTNIAVRNGTVRGWSGVGVDTSFSFNSQLERLRVSNNGSSGIFAGGGSTVSGCTAQSNGSSGIFAGSGSTVSGCTARSNGGDGILADFGSTVSGCTARSNGDNGISALNGSTVSGCTASFNGDDGIFVGPASTVSGCTASSNAGDGIQVSGACRVVDNTCYSNGNGVAGQSAGIHATGDGNRLDGNHVYANNGDGILVDGAAVKNFVIRNTVGAQTCGGCFQLRVPGIPGQPPAGANVVGPVVTDATNLNANAWANIFQF